MFFKKIIVAVALCALSFTSAFAGGKVSYTLHKSANPTADEQEAYKLITIAMDSAMYYYNTYTNLSKYINVYYSTGVPTAEASSNGDLRFGKDRNYMYVGTAMHEIAHTMGMGTTSEYKAMFKDGVFQGQKAQALLKELELKRVILESLNNGKTNLDPLLDSYDEQELEKMVREGIDNSKMNLDSLSKTFELHGDNQHFWPYGINYRSEVRSKLDLIHHAKIVNAMYQDIFKEAFYKTVRIQVAGGSHKCMGITKDNALELMDCSGEATVINLYSVGDNPVTYRIELGDRVIDIPNESTAAGVVASTYGWNGGAHQRYILEGAPVNTPNAFYLQNYKSKLYLQANGTQVMQNAKKQDDSFVWILMDASTQVATDPATPTSSETPSTEPSKDNPKTDTKTDTEKDAKTDTEKDTKDDTGKEIATDTSKEASIDTSKTESIGNRPVDRYKYVSPVNDRSFDAKGRTVRHKNRAIRTYQVR